MIGELDRGDRRAVSPVIGVILLTAISVILAAVVGGSLIAFGSDQGKDPRADLRTHYDGASDQLRITVGSSTTNADKLMITVDGTQKTITDPTTGDSKTFSGVGQNAQVSVVATLDGSSSEELSGEAGEI